MALPINGACRSCGAPIIWLRTANDKPIPVDADSVTVIPIDKRFVPTVHRAHFASCKDADKWRKPKAEQGKLL